MILNISYRFIILTLIAGILFFVYPQIDLQTSSLFFKDSFYMRNDLWVRFVYHVGPLFAVLVGISSAISLIVMKSKKNTHFLGMPKKAHIFLLVFLIIGPWMLVNNGFKEFSGRARPRNIVEFNGTKQFTKVFVIANQCKSNCSFVSGHSAAGFFFCTMSLLFTGRKRKAIFAFGIALGSLLGLVRIIAGGHFLSDVYFSFVVVYLSGLLLHYWMYKDDPR